MSIDQDFANAAEEVKTLSAKPGNDTMLKLYSLFKQGSLGDASGKRPGMMNMVARAKFDAWAALSGTDQDDAKQQYIALVKDLVAADNG